MKTFKKLIPALIMLIIAGVSYALMVLLPLYCENNGLGLRLWVRITTAASLYVSIFAAGVLFFRMINRAALKTVLIVLFSLAMMVIGGAVAFLGILFSKPEYIVEKEGEKYVAVVDGFLKTKVYYYEPVNILVYRKPARIEEYYGDGSINPFKKENEGKYKPIYTHRFDENGHLTDPSFPEE